MGENAVSSLGVDQTENGGPPGSILQKDPIHAFSGHPTEGGVRSSKTPCYTCRRRRVNCDKALPTCQKCYSSGRQCLGYKKPLTWVRGIASRGKMMGLKFDDVALKKGGAIPSARTAAARSGSSGLGVREGVPAVQTVPRAPGQLRASEQPAPMSEGINDSSSGGDQDSAHHALHHQRDDSPFIFQSYIWPALTDPVLEGLDRIERYYLSYYDERFCRLMVLYDIPHQNPYRRLIPLVKKSRALSSAISAVGACHYMHMCNRNVSLSSLMNVPSRLRALPKHRVDPDNPNQDVWSVYQHFLMFKHRALRLLRQDLADPSKRADSTIIASILMLLTLDMVESGQGDWKVHVEGAKGLIKTRLGQLTGNLEENVALELILPIIDSFETFLTGTFMTIDIMGSTFARSGTWSEPIYSRLIRSPNLLSEAETMFLGCPAYLLRIILLVTTLRHGKPLSDHSSLDQASNTTPDITPQPNLPSILAHIEKFDAESWALEMQSRIPFTSSFEPPPFATLSLSPSLVPSHTSLAESFTSLYHLACAYKVAITLYAIRVLLHPSPHESRTTFPSPVTSLLAHLCQIRISSEIFKCTLWPIFIAGSECRDPEQQELIQNLLENLWGECLSVNIKLAGRALKVIWSRREDEGDWIQFLDRSNFSWLFI
ncbi:hypothetical protein VTO42DRAFT_8138 [Malbranchea cinnamomea]